MAKAQKIHNIFGYFKRKSVKHYKRAAYLRLLILSYIIFYTVSRSIRSRVCQDCFLLSKNAAEGNAHGLLYSADYRSVYPYPQKHYTQPP